MQDFGTKADNSPPPGGQLSAAEFNNLATENENAVLRSGQALNGASVIQMAQSLFLHGVKSSGFQDSGAVNAYVATPISGASGVSLPPDYTNMGGAIIAFKAAFTNTFSSTLNIGQTTGTLIGSKPIFTRTGVAIPAGSIVAGQYVQLIYNPAFNSGTGAWEILPWTAGGGLLGVQIFTANGTFTPDSRTVSVIVEVQAGGGGAGGAPATAAAQTSIGAAGSAGSYSKSRYTTGFSSVAVTIGAGGVGGTGTTGAVGGTSSFGALITCPGGQGGVTVGPAAPPFAIATSNSSQPSGGNIGNYQGQGSAATIALSTTALIVGRAGGTNFGPGPAPNAGAAGDDAISDGAGGGGTANGASNPIRKGGDGKRGIVFAWEYA